MNDSHESNNDWIEDRKLVHNQLKYLTDEVHGLRTDFTKFDKDTCLEIALLKQKAGWWGAIAGAIVSVVCTILAAFIINAITK